LNAYKELCSANHTLALEHINRTGDFVREAGAPFLQFYFLTGKADILIELGEYEQAEHCIEATLRYGRKINSNYSEYQCAWLMAVLKFKQKNDEAGYFHLRKYLSISRECGIVNHTFWRSSVIAPLLTKALEADIEVDHVQRLIREHAIEPPLSGQCVKNWPYPVKVYTLSSFSVLVDNKPLPSTATG
jgi:tetratricopeptide (TPR) repeat protein